MRGIMEIGNLGVSVGGKKILKDFNLKMKSKEIVALMGANGSGKTTLTQVLLGDERYRVEPGSQILFKGRDLLALNVTERARAGLLVAWQNPVIIPGVSVFSMCRASYESREGKVEKLGEFKQKLEKMAVTVGLSSKHVERNINEAFSGGEKKRLELLQIMLLKPDLAVLDEVDSGMDAGGVEMVANVVNQMRSEGTSFLLITHNKKMLELVEVDKVVEMERGR